MKRTPYLSQAREQINEDMRECECTRSKFPVLSSRRCPGKPSFIGRFEFIGARHDQCRTLQVSAQRRRLCDCNRMSPPPAPLTARLCVSPADVKGHGSHYYFRLKYKNTLRVEIVLRRFLLPESIRLPARCGQTPSRKSPRCGRSTGISPARS